MDKVVLAYGAPELRRVLTESTVMPAGRFMPLPPERDASDADRAWLAQIAVEGTGRR
jgi:hypothetical protein